MKKIFLAGVLVTLPFALTLFLLQFFFVRIDALLSPAVTKLLLYFNAPINPDFRLPGIGLIAIIILVFFAGLFTRNIIGRRLVEFGDSILVKIPIFKNIYVGAKQVIQTFGSANMSAFKKVVLIEYPRLGIYSLAFVTNDTQGGVTKRLGRDMISIFLPTTPNPTSGFFLMLPAEDITELDISVEDGIKMLISGGLVTPPDKKAELPEKVKADS